MSKLLEVENLVVHFDTDGGLVKVLDGINVAVHAGEILGLVGESGSGKSVSATAMLGMRDHEVKMCATRFERRTSK